MSYQERLTHKVSEIRRLAWKKLEKEYHLAGAHYIPDGSKYDWGIVIEDACGRIQSFEDVGDPDAFQIMQDGLADPSELHIGDDILKNGDERPSPLNPEYLTVAENILAVPEGDLESVQSLVTGWHGAPANFLANVFHRYSSEPRVGHGQLAFIAELGGIADACQTLVRRTQHGVLDMADSAIKKLDNLYSGGWDGSGGAINFTFQVAGAVASIASAGPWVGAAIGLGGYLYGLRDAAGHDPGPEDRRIKGDTVADILASIVDETERLGKLANDEVPLIAAALTADLDAIEGSKLNSFMFVDDGMSGGFDPPVSTNIRLVYEDGYKAGRVYLSAAAYHYQAASARLNACTTRADDAFGWLLDGGPKRDFLQLRDTLDRVLTSSRDYFKNAGEALCDVITMYAQQDGINADELRTAADTMAADDPDLTTLNELDQRQASDFPTHRGPY